MAKYLHGRNIAAILESPLSLCRNFSAHLLSYRNIRVVKLEKEVDSLKDIVEKNAQAIIGLRTSMEQKFSEEHAWAERQFSELRKELNTNFRWMMGTFLTGFLFLLGLMGRIANLY